MERPPQDSSCTQASAQENWQVAIRQHLTLAICGWLALGLTLTVRIGLRPDLPAFLYLVAMAVPLTIIDLKLHRLPDPLVLPSYGIGIMSLTAAAPFTNDGSSRLLHALAGCATFSTLLAVQRFAAPASTGLGDVKLAGVLGLYLGWLGYQAWLTGVFATLGLSGLIAAILLITRRTDRRTGIAYGPFMLAGALTATMLHS